MRFALPLLLIATPLAGCAHRAATPAARAAIVEVLPPAEISLAWRDVARGNDAARIATLAERYAVAATAKDVRSIAGKPRPDPTPGVYDCRIVRYNQGGAMLRLTAFGHFYCDIGDDGDFLTLNKNTGSERPGGRLWRDTGERMVFLGGVPHDGETAPKAYGADPLTDRVGVFERIGDFRWRLIMDAPRPGVAFDVLELTPIAPNAIAAR